MSAYENVVGGKLKLKGKALDVKAGGMKKKKKKHNKLVTDQISNVTDNELSAGGSTDLISLEQEDIDDGNKSSGEKTTGPHAEHDRRYMEQRQKIDVLKLAKTANNKSHRDRISDFNQYLANMSVSITTFLKLDLAKCVTFS